MKQNRFQLTGTVSEMVSLKDVTVAFSKLVNVEKMTEGDKDPMFVTVEVLNPQVSGNKRKWTPELLQDVADQINEKLPDGYMGHLKESDRGSAHPESQTMWVGAEVKMIDGKPRLIAKGYVFPYAKKLREYLKRAISAGKQVAVSVYGQALQEWDRSAKLYNIKNFDLESIDWARPGSQGISGTLAPVLAAEQKDDTMNKEDIIKELTLDEIKELRPDLIEELKKELAPADPEPAKGEEGEGDDNDPKPAEEMVQLRSTLGVDDDADLPTVVSEMKAEHNALLETYIDSKVNGAVTKESLRKVIRKMVVSEMKAKTVEGVDNAVESVLQSDEGKTLIAEMTQEKVTVNPQDDNRESNKGKRKFTSL